MPPADLMSSQQLLVGKTGIGRPTERSNNSFKPNLFRYGKGMAERACHTFASTTQVGLTQALALRARFIVAEIHRLTEDEVLSIRRRMADLAIASQDAFGLTEPLHPQKLSSAVFRQSTGLGGAFKYDTISEVAATLFYGVAMSHSFENGNKRTALVSLLVLLDKNRTLLINAGEDELYDLARQVAAHEIPVKGERNADSEVRAVAEWIREHTRDRVLGDSPTDFDDLREILGEFGCTFDKPDHNFIKIRRDGYVAKTGYPKANFTVPVQEVKRIRRALKLDEIHGLDSAGFYSLEEKVDGFVNTYRNLMKRLADL